MALLTIFTPTYNRKHTIGRTYESLRRQSNKDFNWLVIDDGSSDGTRAWVESLGTKVVNEGQSFDWMGRKLNSQTSDHFVIDANGLRIEYVYKPNGGLYTGYNVAFCIIATELYVCIDSDDYAPDDLVEKIHSCWGSRDNNIEYCGIVGLDYDVTTKTAIGGVFMRDKVSCNYADLHHGGDTKEVLRTELLKEIAPMEGFEGEKDFNPFYMVMQVLDKFPILIDNSNYCWVEYQVGVDSMSQAIYKQYKRSPRSYAKYRIAEMKLVHGNNLKNKFRLCAHYVSACMFAHDYGSIFKNPCRLMSIAAFPVGVMLNFYIRYKAK